MKLAKLMKAAIDGLLSLAAIDGLLSLAASTTPRSRKPGRRRKPIPGQWYHQDAPPREFQGKINFRRSDPRHQQNPLNERYMDTLAEMRKEKVPFHCRDHKAVMRQMTSEAYGGGRI